MKKSKSKYLTRMRKTAFEKVETEVFNDVDFKRMVEETAKSEDVPLDVAESVIKHFISAIPKFLFLKNIQTRVSFFGYLNINRKVKKRKKNN